MSDKSFNSAFVDLVNINYDENKEKDAISISHFSVIEEIVNSLKRFGENKINVDAAHKVTKVTSILVCGPTRVGKSTLIKALTGYNVPTSAGLNSSTQYAEGYPYENGSVMIWDTKGFEEWDETTLNRFWKELFQDKGILPAFCLFCVGVGAHAKTKMIEHMFENYLFRYEIPVCWVITRGGSTACDQLMALIKDGINILGEITEVIDITMAWRTSKGFIVRVNSAPAELPIPGYPEIPAFGINTLCNILARNVSLDTLINLMKLYKNNAGFLSYVYAGLFETAYKLGIPVTKYLDNEKREMFKKLAGKPIPIKWYKFLAKAIFNNLFEFGLDIQKLYSCLESITF